MFGHRILILAPHPDDEVVGCGAAIARAQSQGAEILVSFLTTGVPGRDVLWPWHRPRHAEYVARRRAEAEAAARFLGVKIAGFQDVPTRQLRFHIRETHAVIERTIADQDVDTIWVPAFEGGHQDHDTANFISAMLASSVEVWEFAEYNFTGGKVQSQRFVETSGDELVLDLSAEESDRKRAALNLYPSERGNLAYVEAGRECFRPLSSYDYGRPPHSGTLFYQRFQWVPFRHPRIDFTQPEEVSATLATFPDASSDQGARIASKK